MESGLQKQVSCPKVKSLLTNQLKVELDGSNTNVMTAVSSHTKTNKSFRAVWQKPEVQVVHSNITMWARAMRGTDKVNICFPLYRLCCILPYTISHLNM